MLDGAGPSQDNGAEAGNDQPAWLQSVSGGSGSGDAQKGEVSWLIAKAILREVSVIRLIFVAGKLKKENTTNLLCLTYQFILFAPCSLPEKRLFYRKGK